MSGITVWLEVNKIRVENRIRKNYSHLTDFVIALKEKKELEIPILVACRQCIRTGCPDYRGGSDQTSICCNNMLIRGLCLATACLLDGATRLEAAKKLNWNKINCIVVEKQNESWMKEVEIITNTMRKPFDLWEKVQAALALEEQERMLAQSRSKAGVARDAGDCGRWRDIVAKKSGFKSANSFLAAKKVFLDAHPRIRSLVEGGGLKVTQGAVLARYPEYRQVQAAYLIEKSAEISRNEGKKSARAVSFIIHKLMPQGELVEVLHDKLSSGEIETYSGLESFARNEHKYAKIRKNEPARDCLQNRSETVPDNENIGLRECINSISEKVTGLVVLDSETDKMNKEETLNLDNDLAKIMMAVKTCRDYLRIKSVHFDNSFSQLAKEYTNDFKRAVRFFSIDFPRQIRNLEPDQVDDMHYTFHNAITILHKAALLTTKNSRR